MSLKPLAVMLALGLVIAPLQAAEVPAAENAPMAVLLSTAAIGAAAAASTATPSAEPVQTAPTETPYQKHRRLREELRRKLGPSVHLLN